MMNNNPEKPELIDNISYDFQENLIDDTLCPKCSAPITDDTEFCDCGFYVKASKRSTQFAFVFAIVLLVAITGVFLTKTSFLTSVSDKFSNKLAEKKMFLTASPRIQVETKLKLTGLDSQISNIYEQDYKNQNILVVEVKPAIWPQLQPEKREYILKTITSMWQKAYKGDQKPIVKFANP